jgi:hypothetical protein
VAGLVKAHIEQQGGDHDAHEQSWCA